MSEHLKLGRTRVRVDNIKRLIAALRQADMLRYEIADLLGYSPSGIRKYVRDLVVNEVIQLVKFVDPTATSQGIPLYRLNAEGSEVDAFITMIERCGTLAPAQSGRPSGMALALQDPSRHFHLLQDDEAYTPRVARSRPVGRDPLVAALFGAAAGTTSEVRA